MSTRELLNPQGKFALEKLNAPSFGFALDNRSGNRSFHLKGFFSFCYETIYLCLMFSSILHKLKILTQWHLLMRQIYIYDG
ncbi:hypothetical protein AYO29_02690 [Coxiella burnetii str. Schperling]|nr:hypothetical protein A35_01790 [Coxiella burnetii 'MSU Goat Q177']ATN85479.1 hypothetical protein AYO29_02690 [Coxiella burnetii str. Schperling]PHH57539.1 hypothetical protein CRH12_04605 [Coxiella burnetii]